VTTLGGGMAISSGGMPHTGGRMPLQPIPAEFNHWLCVYMYVTVHNISGTGVECPYRDGNGEQAEVWSDAACRAGPQGARSSFESCVQDGVDWYQEPD